MLIARGIFVGDKVEKQTGKYAGLVGRVTAKRPKWSQFAIQIMVEVDLNKIDNENRDRDTIRENFKKWQSVETWKRIV
jgi:hypothetical protein